MGQMLRESHRHPTIPRLRLDLRHDSPFYQARAFINGRQLGKSTQSSDIRTAFRVAESWYRTELKAANTAAPIDRLGLDPQIVDIYRGYVATLDTRRRAEAAKRWSPIEAFWAAKRLAEVGSKTFRTFYAWRRQHADVGPHTLHKDTTLIRQILKHAIEEEQLDRLPAVPKPGKIVPNPQPWLSASEWQHLCAVSRQRIDDAPNARTKDQRIDCDHFMRFMVASCGRVDEVRGLRFRDCRYRLSADEKTRELLICTVTGKRGTRDLVADCDAVEIISIRLGKPDDLVFPVHSRDAFRELLIAAGLRVGKFGHERNFKSLRATAISFQVIAGKPLDFIARNAGTSPAMIFDFYTKRLQAAVHVEKTHPTEIPASVGRD